MFGDSIIVGKWNHFIDQKHRIFVPAYTKRENGDEICYVRENELSICIYNLKKIKEEFQRLDNIRCSSSVKEKKEIENEINKLAISLLGTGCIDAHGRVKVPMNVLKEFDLKNEIIIIGALDHLKVFKNEENYNEYQKRLINENYK